MDPTTHAILSAVGTLVAARVVAAVRRARLRRRAAGIARG